MAKKSSSAGRAAKRQRQAARVAKQQRRSEKRHSSGCGHPHTGLTHVGLAPPGLDPAGWQFFGPDDELAFEEPAPELMDSSRCPVAESCEACGGTDRLRPVVAAFSKPGGFDVCCATLCHACDDGTSFLHRFGSDGIEAAFARHADHSKGEA